MFAGDDLHISELLNIVFMLNIKYINMEFFAREFTSAEQNRTQYDSSLCKYVVEKFTKCLTVISYIWHWSGRVDSE